MVIINYKTLNREYICFYTKILERIVVLPHIGSATIQARLDFPLERIDKQHIFKWNRLHFILFRTAMAMLTAKNIVAALDGKKMPECFN